MSIEKRFGYYEGSKDDFVNDGLVESTSADKITFIMGEGSTGDAICARNKLFECGGSSGGGSGYVPMDEIQVQYSNSITVSPNTSVVYQNYGTEASISLTAPTDTTVTNTYTIIMRNLDESAPITFDKTIIWANDNTPVLDGSASEIIEINIKCINVAAADGILYLGTWAKYTI